MITYNNILSKMQDKFTELAGYSANDASDIGIRLKVLAGEIYSSYTNMQFIKTQMFPQTATGDYLDMHAEQRGLKRVGATKSKGYLKFVRGENISYSINIPKGTICSTSGLNGVRFVTLEATCLEAGETYASVLACSESAGALTNTDKNTINVIITLPAGVTSVTNEEDFVGGNDGETDEDLRARLLDSYKNIPNGTNCAFYKNIALEFSDVYSASVISRPNESTGTVHIYVAGQGTVLSNDKMSAIQSKINSLKEINVDAVVKAPTTVSVGVTLSITVKDGYSFSTIKTNCENNITNYFSNLHIGEDVLLADIANIVYNTEGVKNYKFTNFNDKSVSDTQLAVLSTVSITSGGADS